MSKKLFVFYVFLYLGIFFITSYKSASAQVSFGPNLIGNFDLEQLSSNGDPVGWKRGRWGTNTTIFEYPASGQSGSRGVKVTIESRTSGDAKWYFEDIPISDNKEYEFSDYYQSNISSYVTARYLLDNGTYKYIDLISNTPPNINQAKVTFTPPVGAVSLTIFHLINNPGYLTTDNYSLREIIETTPGDPDNLITNPSLELSQTGNPLGWLRGRWGNNITNFIYPANGNFSEKSVRVEMSERTSGDAKWYFEEVAVNAGNFYSFENDYRASVDTYITARYKLANGQYTYSDLAILPPSSSWRHFFTSFKVPSGAVSLTIFHLLNKNGWLETDNFNLRQISPEGFESGLISLTFDDGSISIYQNAFPILRSSGLKSTQYMVTDYMSGYPGYMSPSQTNEMFSEGHEIGSHSLNHADLTSLTPEEIIFQLSESKRILEDYGFEIASFAYPFGYNNSLIKQLLAQNGYSSGRATIEGVNLKNSDPYAVKVLPILVGTQLADVKNEIDKALTDKSWLVLLFHQINYGGDQYSTTPEMFSAITNYLNQKRAQVVTVSEAIELKNR